MTELAAPQAGPPTAPVVAASPVDLPAVRFAETARRLGAAAHSACLEVPAFRCPPRVPGADRTIRRYPGGAVVAVRLRGRPFEAALADMVEGVVVANRLPEGEAAAARRMLTEAAWGEPPEAGTEPVGAVAPGVPATVVSIPVAA
jgi:hypothetical protein